MIFCTRHPQSPVWGGIPGPRQGTRAAAVRAEPVDEARLKRGRGSAGPTSSSLRRPHLLLEEEPQPGREAIS